MGYSDAAITLQRPDLTALPRIGDRVSFLFLDHVRVEQGRTGLEAWGSDPDTGQPLRTVIPAAQLAVLCLGPGTSLTGPAMTTLYRSGTTLIITSADGLVATATARPLATDGRWATAQARIHTDPDLRIAAARTLYRARFPDHDIPDGVPLASLRGIEGHRVKATYRQYAVRYQQTDFRRVTLGATDPVNVSLNRANSLLYGVALAVTNALGLSPALGIIHQGTTSAFLYDLADIYKTRVSIPAAFEAATHTRPDEHIGRLVRAQLHQQGVLPDMLALTQRLLTDAAADLTADADLLLDDDGYVPGLTNWALA